MAIPSVSPAVSIFEVDLTSTVPSNNPGLGAFAGHFQWGPVEKRVLINSEQDLFGKFYEPNDATFKSFFTAASYLAYVNGLRVVRANSATHKNATSDGNGLPIKNEEFYEQNYLAGGASVGTWAARYMGDLGNSLTVSFAASNAAFKTTMTATGNTSANGTTIDFSANVLADVVSPLTIGDLVSVNSSAYGEIVQIAASGLRANVNVGSVFTQTSNLASVIRKWKFSDLFDSAPGTSEYAQKLGASNDEIHLVVVDRAGKFTGKANTVLEKFPFLSVAQDATYSDGTPQYYKTVLLNKSKYVYWMAHPTGGTNWGNTANGTTFTTLSTAGYSNLSGGAIGTPASTHLITAYNLFANPEEVDIRVIMTGDAANTVVSHVIQNIAEIRLDSMVTVSPYAADCVEVPGSELDAVVARRNSYPSSSFGVMDSGWKYIYDRYNNVFRYVPLNGDIAGLISRTDYPWTSPAGPSKGLIKNAVKLAWNPTKAQRDELYRRGVNPVVTFPGEGIQLFGDKTMLFKQSAFDRINVRGLFSYLEKQIAKAARNALFEINDEFTRGRFVSSVEPFLRQVQGSRGIYDFRVVCNASNNPPEVIDANQFVGHIFIKPARTINDVALYFIATPTGVSFEEVPGRF